MEYSKTDEAFRNIYRIIEPSKHLMGFVKDYLLLHFVFNTRILIPLKPFPANTDHCLVFYLRGSVNSWDPVNNKHELFAKIAINGSQISPFDFQLSNEFLMLS
jgi:hypothetical protein